MDRIAFTIIQNGLHHLKHNNYYDFILKNFKYWVVVEGASANTGSTSWCKPYPDDYHNNGKSIDGTNEFLNQLKLKYSNLIFIEPTKLWKNKDEQINKCIQEIKKITNRCFLWEIDIDEQWTIEQIKQSEEILLKEQAKTGCFLCKYFIGPQLIVIGEWGEGLRLPYRRLWDWNGEYFETHEPPRLVGGNKKGILIPIKFNHYSLLFEQDVKFKNVWYSGQEGIYERWLKLQKTDINRPLHIKHLLGEKTHWGTSDTWIIKCN